MSFVYARVVDELVFLLADAFSEGPLPEQKQHLILSPLVKLCRVANWVVAFSCTNISEVETALHSLPADGIDALEKCSASGNVDFIAVETSARQLLRVSQGATEARPACYLGSQTAAEKFQERLASKPEERDIGIRLSQVYDVSAKANDTFTQCFSAFEAVIDEGSGDFGGIVVPYVLMPHHRGYAMYSRISRAPIDDEEYTVFGNTPVTFSDRIGGGYAIDFCGGERGFAAFFPLGRFAILYEGFDKSGFECSAIRDVDAYDFHRAVRERIGDVPIIVTGKSWAAAGSHARRMIEAENFDEARALLSEIELAAQRRMESLNEGKSFDFSGGIWLALAGCGECIFDVNAIGALETLAAIRQELHYATRDFDALRFSTKDRANWSEFAEQLRYRVKIEVRQTPTYDAHRISKSISNP